MTIKEKTTTTYTASASIQREAEVALEISDLTYRGKQVPPGHARAIAAFLNARGMLTQESGDPS